MVSTLSPMTENVVRLVHRLAASGVGLLAIGAALIGWTRRPLPAAWSRPIWWMIATTVALAIIGPLTPGYRTTAVTVGNVSGGVLLLMACWWLRESTTYPPSSSKQNAPVLRLALCMLVIQVATGAAASALVMRGSHEFALFHLATAMMSTMFIGAAAWSCRLSRARPAKAVAGLLLVQVVLGFMQLAIAETPLALAFVHGMVSPLLAAALVSLALRAPGPYDATNRRQ